MLHLPAVWMNGPAAALLIIVRRYCEPQWTRWIVRYHCEPRGMQRPSGSRSMTRRWGGHLCKGAMPAVVETAFEVVVSVHQGIHPWAWSQSVESGSVGSPVSRWESEQGEPGPSRCSVRGRQCSGEIATAARARGLQVVELTVKLLARCGGAIALSPRPKNLSCPNGHQSRRARPHVVWQWQLQRCTVCS